MTVTNMLVPLVNCIGDSCKFVPYQFHWRLSYDVTDYIDKSALSLATRKLLLLLLLTVVFSRR